ncbi:AMP-binding protein [Streptomyces sp. JH14]|uniref:AMP-binding protein n=1 Tax=Streptomyces sp. JH14 TaxID=2793630 RepID=UPI0023F79229|nr:AMP-binding protein [Streptomyces sp. JH14]MDF6046124.1 AMP-binding protein [Streptomyces sp. JH14]
MTEVTTRPGSAIDRDGPQSRTLPGFLAERARDRGDDVCLIDATTGESVSYRALFDGARRLGAGLDVLGVAAGDTVATMVTHSLDTYRLWFGLTDIGVLEVPINTKYKGRMLEHILQDSGATAVVIDPAFHDDLCEVLRSASLPNLRWVLVTGSAAVPRTSAHLETRALTEIWCDALPEDVPAAHDRAPHDLSMVMYTSGTTGPSKGVLVPWGQVDSTTTGVFPEDTYVPGTVLYGPFPPNHIGGRLFASIAIRYGVVAVIRDTFSASAFWTDVERYGCTTTALVSAMANILWKAAAGGHDADNSLRDVLMIPLIPEFKSFETRYGVRICTVFNMTEVSVVTESEWAVDEWRSCGRVRQGGPGYELRIVDAHDYPVPAGEVGELVCRTDTPWAMNAGYFGQPAQTAAAWRNGWFHTGDAFRADDEGRFYFVDRIKDAIRRRGENVSSFEVEREVLDHPDVLDCAAIGVPGELGEEEIKVFVVRTAGAELSAELLIAFMASKCAAFMVPRHVEFVDALPKTQATDRVKKAELRQLEAQRRQARGEVPVTETGS